MRQLSFVGMVTKENVFPKILIEHFSVLLSVEWSSKIEIHIYYPNFTVHPSILIIAGFPQCNLWAYMYAIYRFYSGTTPGYFH